MADTIQFKRGAVAGIPTALSGEPLWTTDSKTLYVGDGTTNYECVMRTATQTLTNKTLASATCTGTTTIDQIDNPLLTTVLTVDPIPTSAYRLNETSGTTAADSAGAVPGTYVGSPTLGAAGYVRGQANAVQFAASSQMRVDLGNNFAFANLTPFSVDGWFYKTTGGSVNSIIGKRLFNVNNLGWLLYFLAGDSKVYFGRFNSGGTSNVISSSALSLSTWYHAAATFDGTTMALYINGDLVASTSSSIVNVTDSGATHNAAIGNSKDSTTTFQDYFVGRLQMWNVYTSGLTALQVKKLYFAGSDYLVSGSRGSNAALASLINALVAKGIITDGTT